MSEPQLFTAQVFQVSNKQSKFQSIDQELDDTHQNGPFDGYKFLKSYHNMISARVIKGKIVELEHSSLVSQPVKFKTIINYNKYLQPDTSLGVVLQPQEGYLAKLDSEKSLETDR